MRYLVLLFIVAACTHPPTTLERGTPPVRSPPARPGVGLPRYGAPSSEGTSAPPPRRSGPLVSLVPKSILGWTPPQQLEGGPQNDALPAHCAERAIEQVAASFSSEGLDDLDEASRRCLAATTWAQCVEAFLLDFDRARRRENKDTRAFWDYSKIGCHVRKLVRAECQGVEGLDRYIWRGP